LPRPSPHHRAEPHRHRADTAAPARSAQEQAGSRPHGLAFPGRRAKKRRKAFVATLKRLQDALGNLNDIAGREKMAGELVRRSGRRPRARAEAFAVGLVTGREEARSKPLIVEAADAIADFRKIKPFWR